MRRTKLRSGWLSACLVFASCGGATSAPAPAPSPASAVVSPTAVVELGHASGQFHTVPVHVNEHVLTVAILDTGIGLALISNALCERIGCEIDGAFVGQRMSGQEVRVPLTRLDSLSVGGVVRRDVVAGVIDIEGFFPEPQIEAFVGLPFFRDQPFTIDGSSRTLTLESERSLMVRAERARAFPLRLQSHGPALDSFVRLSVGDEAAEVLMDTGSRTLILHPRYAEALGIDPDGEGVRVREGHDETGNAYRRLFTELDVSVAFDGAPELSRRGVEAMFQEIIYDGLVGTEFLSRFVVTWDLARERLLVSEAGG